MNNETVSTEQLKVTYQHLAFIHSKLMASQYYAEEFLQLLAISVINFRDASA